jgi:2-C-methyl-D-erythritol 4-phosphate cytidylyltransferase
LAAEPGIWAIVPAAGFGVRMQSAIPKQYLPFLGRPVLHHTLDRLCSYPRLQGVLVGIAPEDPYWAALMPPLPPKLLRSYPGGATRAHTVLNGLKRLADLAPASDWVLVHDAVRPCVRHADLDKLMQTVSAGTDGGLLALPVADTVKRADDNDRVIETVPRDKLWRALTPQVFRVGALTSALERALAEGVAVTDEAAAMERTGARPQLVAGHADNIKITLPGDLALAALFLKQQENES